MLEFNSGFAIWVLISMGLFLLLMGKYAVPTIVTALNDREKNIRESLEAAEKALEEARQISRDNEKALREAELKAQQIRKDAVAEAEVIRNDRIEKSRQEAAKLIEDARHAIEQEKRRAMLELRSEVADLAVKSASLIIRAELDKEKNRKLVDEFISELAEN